MRFLILFTLIAFSNLFAEDKILLKLIKNNKNIVDAKILNLKSNAISYGFDRMLLRGKVKKRNIPSGVEYSIFWNKISYNGNDIYIDGFDSKFITKQDVEGIEVTAKGDKDDLLNKLLEASSPKTKVNNSSEINKKKLSKEDDLKLTGLGNHNLQQPQFQNPQLKAFPQEYSNIETVSGFCGVDIDLNQMVAIVLEEFEGNCSESLKRYPIIKNYDCKEVQDLKDMKLYKQHMLTYFSPETQTQVMVEGCRVDENDFVLIKKTSEGCEDVISENGIIKKFRLVADDIELRPCQEDGFEEYITTIEGCGLRSDFQESISFQQERRLSKDGIELKACYDSKISYLHENIPCSARVDYQQKKVFNQYKTIANNIEIRSCADGDFYDFVEGYCEYFHDYSKGISYAQKEIYYMDNGQKIPIQPCFKTDQSFSHMTENCGFEKNNSNILPKSRQYISINDEKIYINQCKVTGYSFNIQEEHCEDNHDFINNFTTEKINRFYKFESEKIYLEKCIDGKTFEHKSEICDGEYSDKNKEYEIWERPYINRNGKEYISECKKTGQKIPYIKTGQEWIEVSKKYSYIIPYNNKSTSKNWWRSDYGETILWPKWSYKEHKGYADYRGWPCDYDNNCYIGMNYPNLTWFSEKDYCVTGELKKPWMSYDGDLIIEGKADWNIESITPCSLYASTNGYDLCLEGGIKSFEYKCSAPRCFVTKYELRNKYERYDGTNYVDDIAIDRKAICT